MKSVLAVLCFAIIIVSCSKISDQEYFDQATKFVKEKNYKDAIKNFELILSEHSDSKLAPKSLVEIARLYESHSIPDINFTESFKLASENYFKVYEKYPDSEEAPISLFQSGFILDNELKNYDEATKRYNLFLQKYPNHKYAAIVQQSLDIMGMDPEDIINKKQSAQN